MGHSRSIPHWTPAENGKWFESRLLGAVPGLLHGFTLRAMGNAAADDFPARLLAKVGAKRLRLLRQVHGTRIAWPDDPAEAPEADGWTGRPDPGVVLGVRTADCLPVLFCHPPSGILGLAHAGWRGATAGVAGRVLKAMAVPVDEVTVALGPAIRPCCYQVGEAVVEAVGAGSPHLRPWAGAPGRFRLDLPGLVRTQLMEAGLDEARIDDSGLCTACRTDLFYSYRAEGKTGRLCAFMGWQAPSAAGRPRRLIGLTGGIASGKSTAARLFADLGARVIDADQVARRVVEPGRPALEEIRRIFGEAVIRPEGTLDREALGRQVFRDPDRRRTLNRIVHPRVEEEVRREVGEILRKEPDAVVVYDVPLLFEAGMEERFDLVVVVYIPREVQARRLAERDRLSPDEVQARLAAQEDIEEKARRAHRVLDNRGTVDDLRRQIAELMDEVRGRGGPPPEGQNALRG